MSPNAVKIERHLSNRITKSLLSDIFTVVDPHSGEEIVEASSLATVPSHHFAPEDVPDLMEAQSFVTMSLSRMRSQREEAAEEAALLMRRLARLDVQISRMTQAEGIMSLA